MTTSACLSYAGHHFPAEIIRHAVWLYFRFPLSLCMVNGLRWSPFFGQAVKLSSPDEKDGPDDGQAEAVWG